MVEQSRKKIWTRVTRFKIRVRFQLSFFLTVIFNWVNIASAWSWTYWLAFHIYPGSSSYTSAWHGMLWYFTFSHISPHFSFPKLFGSPVFQRHVPADVPLTQAMLPHNQSHVWDPSTLSKPMNQRVFVRFLVKFLTKYHSDSVSIETSEPFSWSQHFSLAALQLIFLSWKVYLEQTVTNVYGSRPIKEKKDKQGKIIYLLIF